MTENSQTAPIVISYEIEKQVKTLKLLKIFDELYYIQTNPEILVLDIDPALHFSIIGVFEGRNPSKSFNVIEYSERNGIDYRKESALSHYILSVANGNKDLIDQPFSAVHDSHQLEYLKEFVNSFHGFDEEFYYSRNKDVADSGIAALDHYLLSGAREGRDPNPNFSTSAYAKRYGIDINSTNPLIHYLITPSNKDMSLDDQEYHATPHASSFIASRDVTSPLRCYPAPERSPRINIYTDSVGPSSLFGGVGTAIIFAALLAERIDASLRIITRTEPPQASQLSSLFAANSIAFKGKVEAVYVPVDGKDAAPCGKNEIFITTSWWTTLGASLSVSCDRIFYLLQEDERMFYPSGDEALRASDRMFDNRYLKIVNTKVLFEHLMGTCPEDTDKTKFSYFEPAFPNQGVNKKLVKSNVKKIFFYARPNNDRNLFLRAVEALCAATEAGILNKFNCEIHFVGSNIPRMKFSNGVRCYFHEPMPWDKYKAFLSEMSGGFVLMATPHPSYPPLDMASMGIPVLTNRFGTKRDLSMYSNLIICKNLDIPDLLQGFRELICAMEQPMDAEYSKIERSWSTALNGPIEALASTFKVKY